MISSNGNGNETSYEHGSETTSGLRLKISLVFSLKQNHIQTPSQEKNPFLKISVVFLGTQILYSARLHSTHFYIF